MQTHQPFQKEQKVLQELNYREDIVKTNTGKGGAVAIIDIKDCIKKI